MSVNFVRDTSGILFSGDSATLSINNTAITDFKTYIDNQNNLKQNVITAANPLSLVSNTLSLNIDTNTLQIDSNNKLKVIGGGTGSSQWTTDASNNIYYNNNIGIGQTNQNKALLELYSTNQLLPRILLNGREFNSTNSNIDGVALLCGTNFTDNRQLWIADSSKLVKNSTNPILRVGFTSGSTRIDSLSTDGTTNLPTIFGNSSGLTLDGDTYINGKLGMGTQNQGKGLLELYSTNQLLPRILLNGQEFYGSTSSSNDGIAFILGTNSNSDNKQLWICNSANITKNSTNQVIRIMPNNNQCTIDCCGTDGVTNKILYIGNGSGCVFNGNIGCGTTPNSSYRLNVNGSVNISGAMYCNTTDNNVFVFDAISSSTFGFVKKSGTYSRLVAVSNPICLSTLTSGNLSQSVSGMTFKDILVANSC